MVQDLHLVLLMFIHCFVQSVAVPTKHFSQLVQVLINNDETAGFRYCELDSIDCQAVKHQISDTNHCTNAGFHGNSFYLFHNY